MRGIQRPCRYGTTWLMEGLWEMFGTTYIHNMHLLFGSPFHKNSTVKHAWLGVVFRWVTYREVSRYACKWGQNMLKRPVLVCRVIRQCLKSSGMLHRKFGLNGGQVNYPVSFQISLVFDPFSLKRPYLGLCFADRSLWTFVGKQTSIATASRRWKFFWTMKYWIFLAKFH